MIMDWDHKWYFDFSSFSPPKTLTKDLLGGDKGVENMVSLLYNQPLDAIILDK